MPIAPPQGRKPAFILSHPRTASNLFMKIFKSHPDIVPLEYPFLDSFYFASEPQCDRKGPQMEEWLIKFQEQNRIPKTYHDAFEMLEENIRKAREQVSFTVSKLSERRLETGLTLVGRAR